MKKQLNRALSMFLSVIIALSVIMFIPLSEYTAVRAAAEDETDFFTKVNTTVVGITSGDTDDQKKAKLLTYYTNKFSDFGYIQPDTISTSAQNTMRNNVLMYNETFYKDASVAASTDYKEVSISLSSSQVRDSYMLAVFKSSDNQVAVDASSGNLPKLIVTYKDGNTVTQTASVKTYIRYGDGSTHAADADLYAGHQADNDTKMPFTNRDARIYLGFDKVNTDNIESAKLVIRAKTVQADHTSAAGTSSLNIVVIKPIAGKSSYSTLTWAAAKAQTYIGTVSWDGISEGIIWDESKYGTAYVDLGVPNEFLNYNSRFIQISSLCQTGHYEDAKNALLNFANQTYDVITGGTGNHYGFPRNGRTLEPANRALEFPYIYKTLLEAGALTAEENYEILHWYLADIEFIVNEKTGVVYKAYSTDTIGSNSSAYYTNWGIWHLNGLYNCINFFADGFNATVWKTNFNARLSKVSDDIIYEDGSYKEVTFDYAFKIIEWFTTTLSYMNQPGAYLNNPTAGSTEAENLANLENALVDMVHYFLMCTYPNGILPDYGDGERSTDIKVITATGLLLSIDNLSAHLGVTQKEKFEEIIWYYSGGKTGKKPGTSILYNSSRLAVDRSGWLADTKDSSNSMLFFNAKSGGGHAHRDALSFMFYAKGRELLTDRGTLGYSTSAQDKELREKTYVANTVSINNGGEVSQKNGNTQATAANSLTGTSNNIASTYRAVTDAYNNVTSGGRVVLDTTHKRNITYLKEYDLLFVNDSLEPSSTYASKSYTYSQNWHTLADADVSYGQADSTVSNSIKNNARGQTNYSSGANLFISQCSTSGSQTITAGIRETYDSKNGTNKSKSLKFSVTTSGNASFNTALLAFDKSSTNKAVRLVRVALSDYDDNQASIMRAQLVSQASSSYTDEIIYLNTFQNNIVIDGVKVDGNGLKLYTDGANAYFRKNKQNSDGVDQIYISNGSYLTVKDSTDAIVATVECTAKVDDIAVTWDPDTKSVKIETSDADIKSGAVSVKACFYPTDTDYMNTVVRCFSHLLKIWGCDRYFSHILKIWSFRVE